MRTFRLSRGDIAANINWFLYVPVSLDGSTEISEGVSKPGDYVELRAERDVICVASNCVQMYNNANGFNPTPMRVIVYGA